MQEEVEDRVDPREGSQSEVVQEPRFRPVRVPVGHPVIPFRHPPPLYLHQSGDVLSVVSRREVVGTILVPYGPVVRCVWLRTPSIVVVVSRFPPTRDTDVGCGSLLRTTLGSRPCLPGFP